MFYEITPDGAGFLPVEMARMDVDGLYIRALSVAYCITGSAGTLLINGTASLSPESVLKQVPLLGSPKSLHIIQRHEEETAAAERVKELFERDYPSISVSYESSAAAALLLYIDGVITMNAHEIAQSEFSIITPPECEKRTALNHLNNLFAPLKLLDVHVDVQFNGEMYLALPSLQLSQDVMKKLAEEQKHPKPYREALELGLCMGLFDIAPRFAPLP